ncbi:low-density lipoprotein receptor-like [Homalodisca vitripennis]|uniref:low-density lipoprotein receptor-like n=1 Tax=Homalodisca vitripennis TaxID=197043 RepID=UPI001EEA9189|nr:low-density lipoprotein receptor-like [Homalodisca vitripennis]XP_046672693.1 low-density lipoprotein receptor-like [Homalodisca vitripennis]KAG8256168.1 Low-density lipoprotein receptor- protein 1B [Homalodisca vitripennis]
MEQKNSAPELVKDLSLCDDFAVDWVHDKIYWMYCSLCSNAAFMSMDLEGREVTTVMRRPGKHVLVKRMEIDPYKGVAFWIAGEVIESCTLSGKYFQPNVSPSGVSVRAITLDLQERRVYYLGTRVYDLKPTALFSMDYIGGDHREHVSSYYMLNAYGLGLHGGMVYWATRMKLGNVLYKISVNPSIWNFAKKLTDFRSTAISVKLVHEDIKKEPGEDPCRSISCSHICVSNATSAYCSFPVGMQVILDEITSSDGVISGGLSLVSLTLLLVLVVGLTHSGLLQ